MRHDVKQGSRPPGAASVDGMIGNGRGDGASACIGWRHAGG